MGLSATFFGIILGTFGGLGVFHWVHAQDYDGGCGTPMKGSLRAAVGRVLGSCDGGGASYVIVGVLVCTVLCHVWMWRALRAD